MIWPFNLEQSEPDERVIKLLTDPNNEAKFKPRCYEEQAKKGKNKFGDVLDAESVYDGDSSLDYDEVSRVMDRVEHKYFSSPPAASRTNVLATQPQTSRKAQNGHVRQAKQEAGIDRAPIIVAPGHVKVCGPASSPSPNPHTILFQRPVAGKTLRPAPIEAIVTIGPATDKAIDHLNLEDRWIVALQQLLTNHHSSQWTAKLMSWGLSRDDAQVLSDAILSDVHRVRASEVSLTVIFIGLI